MPSMTADLVAHPAYKTYFTQVPVCLLSTNCCVENRTGRAEAVAPDLYSWAQQDHTLSSFLLHLYCHPRIFIRGFLFRHSKNP